MKFSRKLVSIILGLTALFCLGAILGSYIPNILIYAIIAACSVALVLFGLWFFHGQEEYEDEE